MTAEPTGHVMWSPNPLRQRLANYFLEDVLNLPDDAPRVELRDGVMIAVPSPTIDHQNIGNLLWLWFRQHAPEEFLSATAVGVAVEVVSPGTKRRDRLEKPAEYAAAGVPHFWRIEQDPVHVFAYDLIDGRYELVADSAEELVLSAPFEIKLPIREITP